MKKLSFTLGFLCMSEAVTEAIFVPSVVSLPPPEVFSLERASDDLP
jgi:hypothetical protein